MSFRYPQHCATSLSAFAPDNDQPEALYGLPRQVDFCKTCVISNQRPNSAVEYEHRRDTRKLTINFGSDGICDACKVAARKRTAIDWEVRREELRELCDRYRRSDGSYDCLVPGSGGKDSFYASWVLKHEFGMHPLTVTWAPHLHTEWGWRNFQAWIHAGFDNVLYTPNGRVHRLLTRLALENLLHPFQPFIVGQKALAPRFAALNGIELVFYGEDEAEYGNPIADIDTAERDWRYFTSGDPHEVYLSGTPVADLLGEFGLEKVDLNPYAPADPKLLSAARISVHYLGYYLRWHPQSCYYFAVEHGGFEAAPERTPGTYSKYNSIDDRIDDLHFYTYHAKFGIGRATYDAAQEIRSGDITREEGVALVKRFDGEFPERFANELFAYLSLPAKEFPVASRHFEQPVLDRAYFDNLVDRFRSPHLWQNSGGVWSLRRSVWDDKSG